jgi:hypothetical protein
VGSERVILRAVAGSTLRIMDSATTLRFAQNDNGGLWAMDAGAALKVSSCLWLLMRNDSARYGLTGSLRWVVVSKLSEGAIGLWSDFP